MNKLIFASILSLITPSLWATPTQLGAQTQPGAQTQRQGPNSTVVVGVSGMTCGDCKQKVEGELSKLNQDAKYAGKINKIEVSLKAKSATIQLLDTANMNASEQAALKKDIAAAITRAGYEPVMDPAPAKKSKKTKA